MEKLRLPGGARVICTYIPLLPWHEMVGCLHLSVQQARMQIRAGGRFEAAWDCLQAQQLHQAREEIRTARAPVTGDDWEHLTPEDDLAFTSNSWSIALDSETGQLSA